MDEVTVGVLAFVVGQIPWLVAYRLRFRRDCRRREYLAALKERD